MDRTLMSAYSHLAGLFPPEDKFTPAVDWQPIPVHTVDDDNDHVSTVTLSGVLQHFGEYCATLGESCGTFGEY